MQISERNRQTCFKVSSILKAFTGQWLEKELLLVSAAAAPLLTSGKGGEPSVETEWDSLSLAPPYTHTLSGRINFQSQREQYTFSYVLNACTWGSLVTKWAYVIQGHHSEPSKWHLRAEVESGGELGLNRGNPGRISLTKILPWWLHNWSLLLTLRGVYPQESLSSSLGCVL